MEGKVLVGIFTPAFSYPASLSYAATIKAALADLGLQEDECDFLKQENGRLSCIIKNNSMFCIVCLINHLSHTPRKLHHTTSQLIFYHLIYRIYFAIC